MAAAYTPIHTYLLDEAGCCVTTQPYYYLLYFEKGVGMHTLNEVEQCYNAGDFVLVLPSDSSQIKARIESRITQVSLTPNQAIRFTETLTLLSQRRTFTLDNVSLLIWVNLVEAARLYRLDNNETSLPLYTSLIEAMLQLLTGKVSQLTEKATYVIPPLDTLLHYIDYYVENPHMLQMSQVAQHFRCSVSTFGEWFRRNKNMGYKEYIDTLRTKRLKRWLNNPHITLKEIAPKMGFTDEFHLSKFFKKQTSITPTHYRKQREENVK